MNTILMDDVPLLRTVSQPVADFIGAAVIARRMAETLDSHGGRGLAAVQIGVPLRILLIRERGFGDKFMINPELRRTGNRTVVQHEGCLSVPTYKWGNIERPAKCDVSWLDLDGHEHSATLSGETARIFQHEFDHLEGVLMTDRMARVAA